MMRLEPRIHIHDIELGGETSIDRVDIVAQVFGHLHDLVGLRYGKPWQNAGQHRCALDCRRPAALACCRQAELVGTFAWRYPRRTARLPILRTADDLSPHQYWLDSHLLALQQIFSLKAGVLLWSHRHLCASGRRAEAPWDSENMQGCRSSSSAIDEAKVPMVG